MIEIDRIGQIETLEEIYDEYASGRSNAVYISSDDSRLRDLGIQKGDVITASSESINTGKMYISEITFFGIKTRIKALSVKASAFDTRNEHYSHISFEELTKLIAEEAGLTLNMMDCPDVYYLDITRVERDPMRFLAERMMLEGYQFRITDDTLIVFDERRAEEEESEQLFEEEFEMAPEYRTSDSGLISKVNNSYQTEDMLIETTVESGRSGKVLRISMETSSHDESRRFSKGIIREKNKYEFLTEGKLQGIRYRAGNTVDLQGTPEGFAGNQYIYRVYHDLKKENQTIYARKVIGGL